MTKTITHPLTVAVIGATGVQGGAAARTLIAYGHHVRALTRNTNSTPAAILQELGAEVVQADLEDPASLKVALRGVDAVFGMTTPFETDVFAEVEQGKALIDAAIANHIKHFVFTSVADADRNTGVPHFESKYQVEEYLRNSGLSWTIIAPAAFMDNFNVGWYKESLDRGVLAMPMPKDQPLQHIAGSDIGAFGALAIHQANHFIGKRIDIASDKISGEKLAELFSAAYKSPITYQEISLETAQGYSTDLAAMFTYFQKEGMHADIAALRTAYPEVKWHTFKEWIDEEFKRPE